LKTAVRSYRLAITGILFGACAGYLYYHFVGCASGTCMITSKPINSTAYGAIMGWLISGIFKKEETNSEQNKIENNEQHKENNN
jgi:F0F1-type ATP synthase assembly protein I